MTCPAYLRSLHTHLESRKCKCHFIHLGQDSRKYSSSICRYNRIQLNIKKIMVPDNNSVLTSQYRVLLKLLTVKLKKFLAFTNAKTRCGIEFNLWVSYRLPLPNINNCTRHHPKDEGGTLLRNVCNHLQNRIASQPRRPRSTSSARSEPQISNCTPIVKTELA
jgi:hypothetical protein